MNFRRDHHTEGKYDAVKRKKIIIGILILLAIALLTFVLWDRIAKPLMILFSDQEMIKARIDAWGCRARFVYLGVMIFQVVVAVIPGEIFEIAAGYAFGVWEGTALCILGECLGSLLVFVLVRRFGMKVVKFFFNEEKIAGLKFLKTNPKRNFIFMILYIIPGTPKDLLGYFYGLTDMPLGLYLILCSIGRFPSVITSTVGGNAVGTSDWLFALIVFVITLLISGAGMLIYNKMTNRD